MDGATPQRLDDIPGNGRPISWGVHTIPRNGAFYIRWNGAGGYGDPLERRVELVREDVADGTVSITAAHEIYGVAFDDQGGTIEAGTLHRRAELRKRRKAGEAEL